MSVGLATVDFLLFNEQAWRIMAGMDGDDGFVSMGDTLLIRIEDDLVFVRNRRIMTLRDLNAIVEVYIKVRTQHGMLFALFDASQSEGMDRAARRALTDVHAPEKSADATAIFGASFAIRTLGNMVDRARKGLGLEGTGTRLFATEVEARAYLHQEKIRVQAQKR